MSEKKFMAKKFVLKHIRTKHEDKVQVERERVSGPPAAFLREGGRARPGAFVLPLLRVRVRMADRDLVSVRCCILGRGQQSGFWAWWQAGPVDIRSLPAPQVTLLLAWVARWRPPLLSQILDEIYFENFKKAREEAEAAAAATAGAHHVRHVPRLFSCTWRQASERSLGGWGAGRATFVLCPGPVVRAAPAQGPMDEDGGPPRGPLGGRRGGGRGGRHGGGPPPPMMGGRGRGRMGPPWMDPMAMMPMLLPGPGGPMPFVPIMAPGMPMPMPMPLPMVMGAMRGGRGGGRGPGGRGGGGRGGGMREYFDLDSPQNNRAVLDYGDL